MLNSYGISSPGANLPYRHSEIMRRYYLYGFLDWRLRPTVLQCGNQAYANCRNRNPERKLSAQRTIHWFRSTIQPIPRTFLITPAAQFLAHSVDQELNGVALNLLVTTVDAGLHLITGEDGARPEQKGL